MTPFHIRERLKKLAHGLMGSRKVQEDVFTVRFVLPDGSERTASAERHYTLVMASQVLDTPIATGCPDGRCGLCTVDVLEGAESLQAPSASEKMVLDQVLGADRDPAVRLACHARVQGPGIRIKVKRVWTMTEARGAAT